MVGVGQGGGFPVRRRGPSNQYSNPYYQRSSGQRARLGYSGPYSISRSHSFHHGRQPQGIVPQLLARRRILFICVGVAGFLMMMLIGGGSSSSSSSSANLDGRSEIPHELDSRRRTGAESKRDEDEFLLSTLAGDTEDHKSLEDVEASGLRGGGQVAEITEPIEPVNNLEASSEAFAELKIDIEDEEDEDAKDAAVLDKPDGMVGGIKVEELGEDEDAFEDEFISAEAALEQTDALEMEGEADEALTDDTFLAPEGVGEVEGEEDEIPEESGSRIEKRETDSPPSNEEEDEGATEEASSGADSGAEAQTMVTPDQLDSEQLEDEKEHVEEVTIDTTTKTSKASQDDEGSTSDETDASGIETGGDEAQVEPLAEEAFEDEFYDDEEDDGTCRFYLAESSIPNAGLGVFAGIDIEKNDYVPLSGEAVVQITDIENHLTSLSKLLGSFRPGSWRESWDLDMGDFYLLTSYNWAPSTTRGMDDAEAVESFVPSLGALPNGHPGLTNIGPTGLPRISGSLSHGLKTHRANNPGAGAFTTYHNIKFKAKARVEKGMELFANYGDDWFKTREDKIGEVPLSKDYTQANRLIGDYMNFLERRGIFGTETKDSHGWQSDHHLSSAQDKGKDAEGEKKTRGTGHKEKEDDAGDDARETEETGGINTEEQTDDDGSKEAEETVDTLDEEIDEHEGENQQRRRLRATTATVQNKSKTKPQTTKNTAKKRDGPVSKSTGTAFDRQKQTKKQKPTPSKKSKAGTKGSNNASLATSGRQAQTGKKQTTPSKKTTVDTKGPTKSSFSTSDKEAQGGKNKAAPLHKSDAGADIKTKMAEDLWRLITDDLVTNRRVGDLLPKAEFRELQKAYEVGAAKHSSDSVRSTKWLKENAMCVDNLRIGTSQITLDLPGSDDAEGGIGRGAFARRFFEKDESVSPVPLIHMSRNVLQLFISTGGGLSKFIGQQLLLNYCYGHRHSSVVLLPYAPVVNFINHGADGSHNVELRWLSNDVMPNHHQSAWLDVSANYVLGQKSAGLVMELVATRPIKKGEEILLYYGSGWETAWAQHVNSWKSARDAEALREGGIRQGGPFDPDYRSAADLNALPVLHTDAYPPNVVMKCHVPRRISMSFSKTTGSEARWGKDWKIPPDPDTAELCSIAAVEEEDSEDGESKRFVYTVELSTNRKRRRTVSHVPRGAIEFFDRPYTNDALLADRFRHVIEIPDDVFPDKWKDLKPRSTKSTSLEVSGSTDEQQKATGNNECKLYMAESSIPNSGFGMYTAVDIPYGQDVAQPEIVIQVTDYWRHARRRDEMRGGDDENDGWLLSNYFWQSHNTDGTFEGDRVESTVPGLGMLANSHPGLINCDMARTMKDSTGLHRSSDAGAGAFTYYHGIRFKSQWDIPAGHELFVQYGDQWFESRTDTFGPIPLRMDYAKGDMLVRTFNGFTDEKVFSKKMKSKLWSTVAEGIVGAYSKRLKNALPHTMEEVANASSIGTAAHSVWPEVRRPIEWLEEHGRCLDNIKVAPSSLRQAGRGAFATRAIPEGSIVTTAPLVHVLREDVEMYAENKTTQQLLLNYCYGHWNSTILLFPYSPITNFINHGGRDKTNAQIQWSSLPQHKSDWLEHSVDEVIDFEHSGLVFDIVATRDIEEDEEIFIHYGPRWEKAWERHLKKWRPRDSWKDYKPDWELNSAVKDGAEILTVRDQKTTPYPSNVMTRCYVDPTAYTESDKSIGSYGTEVEWKWPSSGLSDASDSLECSILARDGAPAGSIVGPPWSVRPPTVVYTAKIVVSSKKTLIVSNMPVEAIVIVERRYKSDQFMEGAFRHEIGIPDDMFPSAWMNRARNEQ